ncbi:LSU ribosomal protein L10p (P0) [Crocosphaera watsonii WH 0402]|uniref:LSU ribosomal protein L10p (P0) n=1 Tax=Crocosphaera watsonii WH 0402 TaxID=1284629 RepID=T2JTC6_CROWT|nr:LSU ribosomal protein L10p (P0) [Crocosphaera watsonii WH 0402]
MKGDKQLLILLKLVFKKLKKLEFIMNESFSVPDEKLRQESVKNLQQVQKN